jgi:hypothetical protein
VTECTASAGIGPNVLLARLATKYGKPNGQFRVRAIEALPFLGDLPVEELPGVGWSLRAKLADMGITQVRGAAGGGGGEWVQRREWCGAGMGEAAGGCLDVLLLRAAQGGGGGCGAVQS